MICHSYKDKSFSCHIFSLAGKAYSDQPWISPSFKSCLWLEQVQSLYPSCYLFIQQSSINFSVIGGYTQNISGDWRDLVVLALKKDINFIPWSSRNGLLFLVLCYEFRKKTTLKAKIFQNWSHKESLKSVYAPEKWTLFTTVSQNWKRTGSKRHISSKHVHQWVKYTQNSPQEKWPCWYIHCLLNWALSCMWENPCCIPECAVLQMNDLNRFSVSFLI